MNNEQLVRIVGQVVCRQVGTVNTVCYFAGTHLFQMELQFEKDMPLEEVEKWPFVHHTLKTKLFLMSQSNDREFVLDRVL